MFIFLSILLISYATCFDMPPTWLNPTDLHHSRKIGEVLAESVLSEEPEMTPEPAISEKTITEKINISCPTPLTTACSSYMKRMINLLLFKSNMKNYRLPKENDVFVPLTLHFTSENLEKLHSYVSSDIEDSFSWAEFDQVFSSLFEKQEFPQEKQSDFTPVEHDYSRFIFTSIVGGLLIIGLWLFLTGSLFKSLIGISMVNFCIALVWNLIRAYNKEKEKIFKLQENRLTTMNKPDFFWPLSALFGSNKDDYKHPESDPLFNIDYGAIVIETLCSILNVLPILGEKLGQMNTKFYDEQNWFIRWFLQPIQFIFNPVIVTIFLLLYTIVQKGFWLKLPLISLGVGNENSTNRSQNESTLPQQSPPRNMLHPGPSYVSDQHQSDDDYYVSRNTARHALDYILSGSRVRYRNRKVPYASQTSTFIYPTETAGQKLPTVIATRKGPWQGSVVRYGFIKKKTFPQ